MKKKIKKKRYPNAPKNDNGLIQLIRMGNSIRHKWVKIKGKEKERGLSFIASFDCSFP